MAVFSLVKFRVSFLRIPVSCHLQRRSAAMSNYKAIPDRWVDYIPVGKRIPGTRFIAFKVPLQSNYDRFLTPRQRFSPADLVKDIEKQKEELGLVVDLTCTKRYYSPAELPKTIQYNKIFTAGQKVPNNDVIAEFKSIVTQYLTKNSKNDKLVGVHCTHGLNRTGYLVCRYLIDVLSMEPSEAIEKFNDSRGHVMERSNYLQDLLHGKSRSNPELEEPRANKQQQFSRNHANSRPPPCPEAQPRSHGHTFDAPRFPGPPIAQPSWRHKPGEMMGPRHGYQHPGGKYPSRGPWIPPPGFSLPHMPGPRYSLPHMEGNPPHHFRAPNGPKRHPQRPYPQHRGYDAMNGAPPQDYRPHFPHQSNDRPGHCYPAQPPQSQQHGNNYPYQRVSKPGHKKKPKKPWQ